MTAPVVMGLDLSLAGTGVATRVSTWRHKTKGQKDDGYPERLARIVEVRDWVIDQVRDVGPDLVVLEAPVPSPTQMLSMWDRAKVWWDVVETARLYGIAVAYVPPSTVKKYATGNGGCKKSDMIGAAYKRLQQAGLQPADDNEADAAWLLAMGYDWLGTPLCNVPQVQARALAGAVWPVREGRLAA
jgi:Holliday junction resolvasome RuvABC endonuclease subunit